MTIVTYEKLNKEHFVNFNPQESQKNVFEGLNNDVIDYLISEQLSYAMLFDGHVLAMGGAIRMNEFRYVYWSYLDQGLGKHMTIFVRKIKEIFNALDYPRLEIHTDPEIKEQTRLAEILGFQFEATLKRYGDLGDDVNMWVRLG